MNYLGFKLVKFTDVDDGAPMIDFQSYKDVAKESAAATLMSVDKTAKKMQRIEELSKKYAAKDLFKK